MEIRTQLLADEQALVYLPRLSISHYDQVFTFYSPFLHCIFSSEIPASGQELHQCIARLEIEGVQKILEERCIYLDIGFNCVPIYFCIVDTRDCGSVQVGNMCPPPAQQCHKFF